MGAELTSGKADLKEGIYFGAELAPDDTRVKAGTPLHGANLFPAEPAGLREVVLRWIDEVGAVGANGHFDFHRFPPKGFEVVQKRSRIVGLNVNAAGRSGSSRRFARRSRL